MELIDLTIQLAEKIYFNPLTSATERNTNLGGLGQSQFMTLLHNSSMDMLAKVRLVLLLIPFPLLVVPFRAQHGYTHDI